MAVAPLAALAIAGCGGGGATAATPPATTSAGHAATVGVATHMGLGKILVDSQGRTLYRFGADHGTMSACTGACAANWPPLRATGKLVAGSGITGKLSTTPRSDGGPQVVYAGHPLYRFSADGTPGDATGQGVNAFGGRWYVVAPTGSVITTSTSSGSGSSGY